MKKDEMGRTGREDGQVEKMVRQRRWSGKEKSD
jgi:hypothetical protein